MLDNFFITGVIPVHAEQAAHNPIFVIASFIIATAASYIALSFSRQAIHSNNTHERQLAHWAGALAMGCGIWSMHFIGLLAYTLRIKLDYDPLLVFISLIAAIALAYAVLAILNRQKRTINNILIGATVLGLGIVCVHHMAVASMNMDADIAYLPNLFLYSIAVAISVSAAALWLAFTIDSHIGVKHKLLRIAAALIVAIAICGMHYTGMAATVFIPHADCQFDPYQSFESLAIAVILLPSVFVGLFMFAASRRLFLIVSGIILFSLPLIVTIYQTIIQLEHTIADTVHEQHGLRFHRQLFGLLKHAQDMRGLSYVVQSGDGSFRTSLQAKKTDLLNALEAVDLLGTSDLKINSHHNLNDVLTQLMVNIHPAAHASAQDNFNAYTQTLSDLIHFMVGLAETTHLNTDGDRINNRMQDIGISIIPALIENIAHMRSYISGLIAAGIPPDAWPNHDRDPLIKRHYTIETQYNDVDKKLHHTALDTHITQRLAAYHTSMIAPHMQRFKQQTNTLLFNQTNTLSAKQWFDLSNAMLESYSNLYIQITDTLLTRLQERQKQYENRKNIVGISSLTALMGLITLLMFLYNNLTAAERLKKSTTEESLKNKLIMDNVTEGIVTFDSTGVIQTFNNAAEYMFGWRTDEVRGKNIRTLILNLGQQNQHTGNYLISLDDNTYGADREITAIRNNGDTFPIVLTVSEVVTGTSRIFVGLIRDITLQKEKEDELRIAKKRAEIASTTKSEFLANMSHELRTPLNSIIGMIQLIMNDDVPDALQENLNVVEAASHRLLEIINDILDLSKIESGNIELERVRFNPVATIRSIIAMLTPLAHKKGLLLNSHINIDDDIYVYGDPTRYARIVTNLIGNAVKYTEHGAIDVTFQYLVQASKQAVLSLDVKDSGIGIPEHMLDKIFDKFIQADSSITRRYGGSGLGLAITKQLIDLMGGEISVKSTLGIGSTFTAIIPFDKDEGAQALIPEAEEKIVTNATLRASNARVLVAEDHPLNQAFIRKLLPALGILHFKIVENGMQAVEAVGRGEADLVLMDCHMPELSGYEAATTIRTLPNQWKDTPIVAMTANALTGEREKCLRAGMDDYITKPVDQKLLANILSRWLVFDTTPRTDKTEPDAILPSINNIINIELLDNITDGEIEKKKEFCAMFKDSCDLYLQKLPDLCVDGISDAWVNTTHALKSGAATIGAEHFVNLCAKAQSMKDATRGARVAMLEEITAAYDDAKEYLRDSGLM